MEKINAIIDILQDVKAKDIMAYDFQGTSPYYDSFIIATANERQASAAVNHIKQKFGMDIRGVEGKGSPWVLIDLTDIVIHIFREEDRAYYNFEQRLLGIKRII